MYQLFRNNLLHLFFEALNFRMNPEKSEFSATHWNIFCFHHSGILWKTLKEATLKSPVGVGCRTTKMVASQLQNNNLLCRLNLHFLQLEILVENCNSQVSQPTRTLVEKQHTHTHKLASLECLCFRCICKNLCFSAFLPTRTTPPLLFSLSKAATRQHALYCYALTAYL